MADDRDARIALELTEARGQQAAHTPQRLIGHSEMLQEEVEEIGEETFLPDLQKINAAGKHLLGLINDILDLSKIEAGRMDLFLETFEVGHLVRDVEAIVQPLMDKNANVLIVVCPGDLGTMHADQTKLRQTLFNLLSNAAKFTDHGTITLRARRQEGGETDRPEALQDGGVAEAGRLGGSAERMVAGDAGRLGRAVERMVAWKPAPTRAGLGRGRFPTDSSVRPRPPTCQRNPHRRRVSTLTCPHPPNTQRRQAQT